MSPEVARLLWFFPVGYLLSVSLELPVLWFGLPGVVTRGQRLEAGFWLTACTYPIVVIALPILMSGCSWTAYVLTAESFAMLAECALFLAWLPVRQQALRCCVMIGLANLTSWQLGGWLLSRFT